MVKIRTMIAYIWLSRTHIFRVNPRDRARRIAIASVILYWHDLRFTSRVTLLVNRNHLNFGHMSHLAVNFAHRVCDMGANVFFSDFFSDFDSTP